VLWFWPAAHRDCWHVPCLADSVWVGAVAGASLLEPGHDVGQAACGLGGCACGQRPHRLPRQRARFRMDPAMTNGAPCDPGDRADVTVQASAHDAMESRSDSGRLRTYLGIAPGVGRLTPCCGTDAPGGASGVDAVVAYRERHGRAATGAQVGDSRSAPYPHGRLPGRQLRELDVTAILERRPELALVDELATRNLPGERYAKRWHDVAELLANGIDVYTTLNVANIESLGTLVSRITGVHAAEPVRMPSCAPARSSSSTWHLRRSVTGWPRAWLFRKSGSMRPCRAISASRISLPCGNSHSSGSMTPCPIQVAAFLAARGSATLCRPRSSWSAWRSRPPTNGSSGTPPPGRAVRLPGSRGTHPGY